MTWQTLSNGDVLEYHGVESGHSFSIDMSSRKVQICLDASLTSHKASFDEDSNAFEVSARSRHSTGVAD